MSIISRALSDEVVNGGLTLYKKCCERFCCTFSGAIEVKEKPRKGKRDMKKLMFNINIYQHFLDLFKKFQIANFNFYLTEVINASGVLMLPVGFKRSHLIL